MTGFLDQLTRWLGGPADKAGPVPPVPAPALTPAALTPVALRPDALRPDALRPDDPRIPDASRPRVTQLLGLMADIAARSQADPLLVSAQTEVRQMRDTHLPQLVKSYAEIPAAHRAEIFRTTGRSASYNLNAAFDRMIARLETLSRTMAQGDIDSFADTLRFIERRYGNDDPAG